METDKIPSLLRRLVRPWRPDSRCHEGPRRKGESKRAKRDAENDTMPRFRSENGMDFMEPDWDELDRKANLIIARYTVISTASNVLPFGLDIIAVTATSPNSPRACGRLSGDCLEQAGAADGLGNRYDNRNSARRGLCGFPACQTNTRRLFFGVLVQRRLSARSPGRQAMRSKAILSRPAKVTSRLSRR
jgi:hypothetical protein